MKRSAEEPRRPPPIAVGFAGIAARLRRRPSLQPTPQERDRRRKLAAVSAMAAAALIAAVLLLFDAASVPWAHGLPPGPARLFRRITRFGQSDWLLIPTGVFVLLLIGADWRQVPPRLRLAWAEIGALLGYFFFAVAISGLLTDLVKWLVARSRPMLFQSEGLLSFHPLSVGYAHASFPSGHATTVAAATVAIALISRRWAVPVGILAAIIALSRVAVGAHYPSDVVAGICVGTTYTYGLAAWLVGKRIAFRRDATGWIRPRTGALRRALAAPGGSRALLAAFPAAIGAAFAPPRRGSS